MSDSKQHFDEFQDHSKHKHLILREYFLAWGHKLGLRLGADDKIVYVDACAGRGQDEVGNHGSPMIAASAAALAQASVSARRNVPFTIHVIAIEANRAHFDALTQLLAPFGSDVEVVNGTLGEKMTDLDARFATAPRLTFIDPFGLDPLRADVVRDSLRGERSEALLLFADQAALRHFGALTTVETKAERRHREAATPLPMFPDLLPPDIDELAQAASVSRSALEITRANADRIMNAAFGDQAWQRELDGTPPEQRRRRLIELYSDRLRSWGAVLTLRVPIVDASGTHAYTLIHASKRPKAYRTMKEAVTYALNHSPLPTSVVAKMRDQVRCDLPSVERIVRANFAGKTVRWTEDETDARIASVRAFVLESTELYPFELEDLKARLKSIRIPGRTLAYAFPVE